MPDNKKTQYRISLKDLKLVIIDENFYDGKYNTTTYPPMISIIAVGDLYQLPPIKKKAIFDDYKMETLNLCHPWSVFKMIELTEIMRQKNDKAFAELLNRIRTASHTEHDIKVLQSRRITPTDPTYPSDALHIWAENAPVNEHNQTKLETIEALLFLLPKNVNKQEINSVLARGCSETGGLDF